MPAKKEISLLPDEENLNSTPARVLRWATTIGRYVIVFTELIVISAFISRFWLDRKNSDLSEIIRQQKAILQSTQQFENDFSQLKYRLENIKKTYANQPPYDDNLQSLIKSTPPEIIYNNINVRPGDSGQMLVRATLISHSEEAMIDYISNLIINPDIQKVDIDTIEKKEKSTTYSINLSLIFSPKSTDQI